MSDGASPFDLSTLFGGLGTGAANLVTGQSSDLRPRIVLHTPAGDTVIDPWVGGASASGGTVTIAGIPMPYEIVWGQPQIPVASQLGPRLETFGALALLGLGILFLVTR